MGVVSRLKSPTILHSRMQRLCCKVYQVQLWMLSWTILWSEGARGVAVADCGQESDSLMHWMKSLHLQMRVRDESSG